MDVEDRLTALHEAGHVVTAVACGRSATAVTIVGGRALGCAESVSPPVTGFELSNLDEPFSLWPGAMRDRLERDVLFSMSGSMAETLFGPLQSRAPDTIVDQATEQLRQEISAPSADLQVWAAEAVNDPDQLDDLAQVVRAVKAAHGQDGESAAAWLAYLERQTRILLIRHQARVIRLADLLGMVGMLDADGITAALESDVGSA